MSVGYYHFSKAEYDGKLVLAGVYVEAEERQGSEGTEMVEIISYGPDAIVGSEDGYEPWNCYIKDANNYVTCPAPKV